MVDKLADLMIGRDAGHIADFWARAWKDINFLGHKGVPVAGISALDGAFGNASGVTLYRLLGGAKKVVPVYQSGGLWLSPSTNELAAEAGRFIRVICFRRPSILCSARSRTPSILSIGRGSRNSITKNWRRTATSRNDPAGASSLTTITSGI
jgi:hypothetical protein